MALSHFSPLGSEPVQTMRQKDCKRQGWWMIWRKTFPTHCGPDDRMDSQRLWQHSKTCTNRGQSPSTEGGGRHWVCPLTNKLFPIDSCRGTLRMPSPGQGRPRAHTDRTARFKKLLPLLSHSKERLRSRADMAGGRSGKSWGTEENVAWQKACMKFSQGCTGGSVAKSSYCPCRGPGSVPSTQTAAHSHL